MLFERSAVWVVLGIIGIVAFAAAQVGALYAVVTPWWTEATRRRLLAGFAAAAVLSVPLVGPVGTGERETWAWLGGSIVGSAPLLVRRRTAVLATVATLAVAVGVAWWTGGSVVRYALITISIGLLRMIVANDGAAGAGPDRHSFGLRGLSQRLADAGGTLHTRNDNGVFTLEATLPEPRMTPCR